MAPQSLIGLSCSSESSFGGLTNQWLGLVSFLGYVDDKMCFSDVGYFWYLLEANTYNLERLVHM